MTISSNEIDSVFLVRSEHLNHQGHLFGGDLMAEIDLIGYCMIRKQFGAKTFVTRAAEISFEKPAHIGDAIVFHASIADTGRTSAHVTVTGKVDDVTICTATMTYVNLGPDGQKRPVNDD